MKTVIKFNPKGQSLVEGIVACGILGVVLVAIMSIVIASRTLLYTSEDQTKATALAQEGIEIARHQRDIGCSFDNITDDSGNLVANTWHITSDTVSSGSDDTNEALTTTGSGDKIQNFDNFTRTIEIRDLADSQFDSMNSGGTQDSHFQSGANCGTDNDYDCRDKYYFIKVVIQKNSVNLSETSTIMSK